MITVLSETQPVARKKYPCVGCNIFLDSGLSRADMTARERETTRAAKKDGWAILPGMQYRKSVYVEDGVFYTYRARLDMDRICATHGLFEDCL